MGKSGYIVPNGFNYSQLVYSNDILRNKNNFLKKDIYLGYFSGSRTHQDDFREIYPTLVRLLNEINFVHLMICGDFDFDDFPELIAIKDRVHQVGFVDWRALPQLISQCDIQLVPLEINDFTNAKSQLKYYEAALLSIPSVASPTFAFKQSITNGFNGFLATTPEEWYESLRKLVLDSDLRRRIGENARQQTLETFGPKSIGKVAVQVYKSILSHLQEKRGLGENNLRVTIHIHDVDRLLATRSPLINIANSAVRLGVEVIIHFNKSTSIDSQKKISQLLPCDNPLLCLQSTSEIRVCDLLLIGEAHAISFAKRMAKRTTKVVAISNDPDSQQLFLNEGIISYSIGIPQEITKPIAPFSFGSPLKSYPLDGMVDIPDLKRLDSVMNPKSVLMMAFNEPNEESLTSLTNALTMVIHRHPSIKIRGAGLVDLIDPVLDEVASSMFGDDFIQALNDQPICIVFGSNPGHPLITGLILLGFPMIFIRNSFATPNLESCPPGFLQVAPDENDLYRAIDSLLVDRVRLSSLLIDMRRQLDGFQPPLQAVRNFLDFSGFPCRHESLGVRDVRKIA